MIMPASAIVPSIATKPNGTLKTRSAAATPIKPSGAVSSTSARREKLCSCSMSARHHHDDHHRRHDGDRLLALAGILDGAAGVDAVAGGQLRADAARAARSICWLTTGAWMPSFRSARTVIAGRRSRRQYTPCSKP